MHGRCLQHPVPEATPAVTLTWAPLPFPASRAHRGGVDVDQVAVELYGLALEEFTAARNQAAKTARDHGDARGSAAIKVLRKPTLAAWLANQLVRADPDGINDLTELGEKLRAAHLAADGARLRQLTDQRHRLVRGLVKTARDHAASRGHAVSGPVAERLSETLDAALVDPGAAQLLRSGQLTSALRHVGFGVVDETGEPAQLAPIAPRIVRRTLAPKTPAKPSGKRAAKRRADAGDQTLQRRRAELQAHADELQAAHDAAEAARAAAESELDAQQHLLADLAQTIERLTEELDHARRQLRTAERDTARLERRLAIATRDATGAQRRLEAGRQRLANLDR